MSKPTKAGQRIGDWFLWIDCEIAKTDSYRRVPLVTFHKAVKSGEVLSTVVATKEMANELRAAADSIDAVISSLQDSSEDAA